MSSRYPPERLSEALEPLRQALASEPLEFAFLHGSSAEGRSFRDVDVAAYVDPAHPGLRDPLTLIMDMGDRLERTIGLPVDVHLLNGAPLGFCYQVTRGRLLWSRDAERLGAWRERVWADYLDAQPYFQEQARAWFGLPARR